MAKNKKYIKFCNDFIYAIYCKKDNTVYLNLNFDKKNVKLYVIR